jgi:DnaJ-domain-containing protein 1
MGIWSRLGNVIKYYLTNEDDSPASSDPDLDAAFEELDGYLNRDKGRQNTGGGWNGADGNPGAEAARPAPEALRPDFAELGVDFGASAGECKAAYKKLLKIHHPDRHANHAGNFKKATDKAARINAAYDRIEKWRSGFNR